MLHVEQLKGKSTKVEHLKVTQLKVAQPRVVEKTDLATVDQDSKEKVKKPSAEVEIDRKLFSKSLEAGLKNRQLKLTAKMQSQMADYYELLVQTNTVMNLTGITEASEVAEKHMVDSLMLLEYLTDLEKVADMGSGAGLPGIPLAIAKPRCQFVLIDSLQKRCKFLQKVVAALELKNVEIVWGRAEDLAHLSQHWEAYDVVTARAVANLPALVEYALPFVKPQGFLAAMKSSKAAIEVVAAKNALSLLNGVVTEINNYNLAGGEKRSILLIQKQKSCSKAYPRRATAIKKTPL